MKATEASLANPAAVAVAVALAMLFGLLALLALLLYRRNHWWPALVAAALALAVRELAAPFVLLWLVFALAEQRWREASAVAAIRLRTTRMDYSLPNRGVRPPEMR